MNGPQIAMLPDGCRLHMNHGPIDLIVQAFGQPGECERAYRQAAERFATVLEELVAELPPLRSELSPDFKFRGPVARRMAQAVTPHSQGFVTPMAAVAVMIVHRYAMGNSGARTATPDISEVM